MQVSLQHTASVSCVTIGDRYAYTACYGNSTVDAPSSAEVAELQLNGRTPVCRL